MIGSPVLLQPGLPRLAFVDPGEIQGVTALQLEAGARGDQPGNIAALRGVWIGLLSNAKDRPDGVSADIDDDVADETGGASLGQ